MTPLPQTLTTLALSIFGALFKWLQTIAQISIEGTGAQGLNTEVSPFQEAIDFALVADNAVIDRIGRLAAREAFADYVKTHDVPLAPDERMELVRMDVVFSEDLPPQVPIEDEPAEFNVSEFNASEYSGINLNSGRLCSIPLALSTTSGSSTLMSILALR